MLAPPPLPRLHVPSWSLPRSQWFPMVRLHVPSGSQWFPVVCLHVPSGLSPCSQWFPVVFQQAGTSLMVLRAAVMDVISCTESHSGSCNGRSFTTFVYFQINPVPVGESTECRQTNDRWPKATNQSTPSSQWERH